MATVTAITPLDRVGRTIRDPAERHRWCNLVRALHAAGQPGQPLEGWVFHGTHGEDVPSLQEKGVLATEAIAQGEDGIWHTFGTHWATPLVAAYYAEDRLEMRPYGKEGLVIVAVELANLQASCELAADAQTVEWPIISHLEHDGPTADRIWQEATKGWEACWQAYGTLLALGATGPEDIEIIRAVEDVEALVERMSARPSPK